MTKTPTKKKAGRKRKKEIEQTSIGKALEKRRNEFGFTQAQLAEKTGVSQQAIAKIERGETKVPRKPLLAKLGYILDSDFGDPTLRKYMVESEGSSTIAVLGWVAAGKPIKPFPTEQTLNVPTEMLSLTKQSFALQVQGESMKDVGILHGDIIVLHQCPEPRNGQVVVVRIDDEYTLKVWHRKDGKITLKPENEEFDHIELEKGINEVECLGEYAGLIRFAK